MTSRIGDQLQRCFEMNKDLDELPRHFLPEKVAWWERRQPSGMFEQNRYPSGTAWTTTISFFSPLWRPAR